MRTVYHEFESLEHILASRLLPGGDHGPIRFVVFGGTGAVGGASVLELCRLIQLSTSLTDQPLTGEIYATGLGDKEISKFVSRLYLALDDEVDIEKIEPLRHYRLDGRIDLHFSILRLQLPTDLDRVVDAAMVDREVDELPQVMADYFDQQPKAFLDFVRGLDLELLHAVVVAIPLPSVATYTMTSIDRLLDRYDLDHKTGQRIKTAYLQTFVRGLAIIQQRYARHVVMAHTTAVGGMYRVDGESTVIRLGFAHSALGKKLVDKKYFADQLTQLFVDQGFDVLVTAAAIGIDAVDFRCHLPSDRAVMARLAERAERAEHEPWPGEDLTHGRILLYPFHEVRLDDVAPEPEALAAPALPASAEGTAADESPEPSTGDEAIGDDEDTSAAVHEPAAVDPEAADRGDAADEVPTDPRPREDTRLLRFGQGKDLLVDSAIRSGENGLFSVANCVALYNVMKVAIPEELAMVLVRRAVFGPERRRDWFADKISFYTETENSYFALRLLESYSELVRAHHGAFAVQAYQALGSSTHQARLHELGLLMLALRLRELRATFAEIPEKTLQESVVDLDGFLWTHTSIPAFEDLDDLDAATLSNELSRLCEVDSTVAAGLLLDYDPRHQGVRQPGREKFLNRLATRIRRHLQIITSLGTPIIYRRSDGEDRVLVGPYVAPLDTAVAHADDLPKLWRQLASNYGASDASFRDWVVANNGFIDLRSHAIGSAAQEPGPRLADDVRTLGSEDELVDWLSSLTTGHYFTVAGTVALLYRLRTLGHQVRRRRIQLGTRETWKHLFRQDRRGRHLISPGLVETVRMYREGLGKITGTEALWPRWGY
ncbi:MAG: hypothetical protein AAGE94_01375 [Acidobacteriota bacterium]